MSYQKTWQEIRKEKCPACGRIYSEHTLFSEWLWCQDKLFSDFKRTVSEFNEAVVAARDAVQ